MQFESEAADQAASPDISEVVCYVQALQAGLARVEAEPISLDLIRDIHRILLSQGRGADRQPGEFRQVQNWIGPKGGLARATFVPPPPENLPEALTQLVKFANAPPRLPIVIAAGLLHVQFETIHPFLDGNGRTGRLLLTLVLCQRKILSQPLLYLSEYFKQRRAEYYDRLQAVRDYGDWEGWTRFYFAARRTGSRGSPRDRRQDHQTSRSTPAAHFFPTEADRGHDARRFGAIVSTPRRDRADRGDADGTVV